MSSDEVLRKEVESHKAKVDKMLNAVKEQRMTLNINNEFISERIASRIEPRLKVDISKIMTATTMQAQEKVERSYNLIKSNSDIIRKDTVKIYQKVSKLDGSVNNITSKSIKILSVFTAVIAVLLIALITLALGGEIVQKIYDWTYLNRGVTLAYKQFFDTSGWGYVGWGLALIGFIAVQLAVLFGFATGLYKLTKKVLDS